MSGLTEPQICLDKESGPQGPVGLEVQPTRQPPQEDFGGRSPDASASASVPTAVSAVFSQSCINKYVRTLFPHEWLHGFALPYVEDLLNQPPFSLWRSWGGRA